MTGRPQSIWPPDVKFYLDACLPKQIAEALSLLEYPIVCPENFGNSKRDEKDPILIPWLGKEGYVWITRDDAAKKAHGPLLKQHSVPTIWIRGVNRNKKTIRVHDVHYMLTAKLVAAAERLDHAKGLVHHELYLNVDKPTLVRIDPVSVHPTKPFSVIAS